MEANIQVNVLNLKLLPLHSKEFASNFFLTKKNNVTDLMIQCKNNNQRSKKRPTT